MSEREALLDSVSAAAEGAPAEGMSAIDAAVRDVTVDDTTLADTRTEDDPAPADWAAESDSNRSRADPALLGACIGSALRSPCSRSGRSARPPLCC